MRTACTRHAHNTHTACTPHAHAPHAHVHRAFRGDATAGRGPLLVIVQAWGSLRTLKYQNAIDLRQRSAHKVS
eukprot:scaffold54403_cov88-Phaeocystis_antarctica.AAC.1